jgi:DNA-binding GntR family transcriptional regulator
VVKLARPTSGDQVARHIRRLIVDGTLRRGDRVPQDEIAAELGVSRIPVREGIVALDREGWVTLEPHRGAFVHGVDEPWVRDHYDILGELYGLAARRATERGTPDDVTRLNALLKELQGAGDVELFDAVNERLLVHVLAMARAPRIRTALRSVTSVVPGNFFAQVPGAMEAQRRGIAPVVRAVAARDGDRAGDALRTLLARQGSAVVDLLRDRQVLADE